MSDDTVQLVRVQRAIYFVGGLVLGLFGLQSIAGTSLGVYGYYFYSPRATPSAFQGVSWGVDFLIGFLFLAGGALLLALGFRAGRAEPASVDTVPR